MNTTQLLVPLITTEIEHLSDRASRLYVLVSYTDVLGRLHSVYPHRAEAWYARAAARARRILAALDGGAP